MENNNFKTLPLYGDKYNHSQDYTIETMKSLQKQKLTIGKIETYNIAIPTEFQKQIQNLLVQCE